LLNQSQKNSKLALTRAKLRSMHSELSYGLSIAPKLQRVGSIHISGWDQPTPDPSFSLFRRAGQLGLRFNSKVARASRFQWGIFIFLAAEKLTFWFWGGGITSKPAFKWPSWGIYKHAPPVFWRKRRLLYWKKGGQI